MTMSQLEWREVGVIFFYHTIPSVLNSCHHLFFFFSIFILTWVIWGKYNDSVGTEEKTEAQRWTCLDHTDLSGRGKMWTVTCLPLNSLLFLNCAVMIPHSVTWMPTESKQVLFCFWWGTDTFHKFPAVQYSSERSAWCSVMARRGGMGAGREAPEGGVHAYM